MKRVGQSTDVRDQHAQLTVLVPSTDSQRTRRGGGKVLIHTGNFFYEKNIFQLPVLIHKSVIILNT